MLTERSPVKASVRDLQVLVCEIKGTPNALAPLEARRLVGVKPSSHLYEPKIVRPEPEPMLRSTDTSWGGVLRSV